MSSIQEEQVPPVVAGPKKGNLTGPDLAILLGMVVFGSIIGLIGYSASKPRAVDNWSNGESRPASQVDLGAERKSRHVPDIFWNHRQRFIQDKDLGEKWPFLVPEGFVVVGSPWSPGGTGVFFCCKRMAYPVNGTALTQASGFSSFAFSDKKSIWRDNDSPDAVGLDLKINIGPIIDMGLAMATQ